MAIVLSAPVRGDNLFQTETKNAMSGKWGTSMNADSCAEANEADRLEGRPITLADQIARWTAGKNRFDGPIPGLALHRWETPTEPTSYLLPPSLCLIGQGRKRLFLGEDSYVYGLAPVPGRPPSTCRW
ncbi:MAG: AraC family transcriptional regulator [Candidatus Competibacteraceae bacterium]